MPITIGQDQSTSDLQQSEQPQVRYVGKMDSLAVGSIWSIPTSIRTGLPENYTLRPLIPQDYDQGYLRCLAQLTTVGDIPREQFLERYEYMRQREDTYFPLVIADHSGRIVGAGTLVVERKFIRKCAALGHIEDIVVLDDQRGKGLGRLIIRQLCHLAWEVGCYKVTLDCEPKNEQFYAKCDLSSKGFQMAAYLDDYPRDL